jgi:hypothetical protein
MDADDTHIRWQVLILDVRDFTIEISTLSVVTDAHDCLDAF